MGAITKINARADWELVFVFGGWITFEILILFVCILSM